MAVFEAEVGRDQCVAQVADHDEPPPVARQFNTVELLVRDVESGIDGPGLNGGIEKLSVVRRRHHHAIVGQRVKDSVDPLRPGLVVRDVEHGRLGRTRPEQTPQSAANTEIPNEAADTWHGVLTLRVWRGNAPSGGIVRAAWGT